MPIKELRDKVKHAVTVKSIANHLGLNTRTIMRRAKDLGMRRISSTKGVRYRALSEESVQKLLASLYSNPPQAVRRKKQPEQAVPAEEVKPWDL